jgi:alkylhydroperoxidase/carboxymuconolactone decarboxylase family protein YurZ
MDDDKISNAFKLFMTEAPKHSKAWMDMVMKLSDASVLDAKTSSLAYLSVLAVLGMESGIPFHVGIAKQNGCSKEEIISAILIGLPAIGHKVTQVLPIALESFDNN